MAAKKDPLYEITHVEVDPKLIPLTEENVQEFTELDGEGNEVYPFCDFVEENGETIAVSNANFKSIALDPEVVIVETQPHLRQEGSGLLQSDIIDLAESIKESGQLAPVIVRVFRNPEDNSIQYHLVAGLRRTLAIRALNTADADSGGFPLLAIVRVMTNEQAYVISLIENTKREQMTPGEISIQVRQALASTKGNAVKAAAVLGIGRQTVQVYKKIIETCDADPTFKSVWEGGALGYEAAAELLKTDDVEKRSKMIAAAFGIEAQKVAEQVAAIEQKAVAAGVDPKAAVAKAQENAKATAVQTKGGASKSALVNAVAGKVSASSVAAAKEVVETGTVKAKAFSAKQIADILTSEFTTVLFQPPLVTAIAYFANAITDSTSDMGLACQMLASCFDKKFVGGVAAPAKVATKTAAPAKAVIAAPATPAGPVAVPAKRLVLKPRA